MDLGKIKVDNKAAEEGVWFKIDDKTRLLIARMGNAAFNTKLENIASKNQTSIYRGEKNRKEQEALAKEACAGTILLGWEHLLENGKELPYTVENAKRLMTQPEYAEFQDLVLNFAQEKAAFRLEFQEEDIKKSETSSDGKSKQESTPKD